MYGPFEPMTLQSGRLGGFRIPAIIELTMQAARFTFRYSTKKRVYIPVVVVLYTTYFVEVVVRFRETSTASTPFRAGAQ